MDDTDKEGSRSIPSRTRIGKQAAILEKFPFLGEPLVLFGGLITVPFWGYRNTPLAYLDVMMSDLPHVEYRKEQILQKEVDESLKKSEKIKEKAKHGLGINMNKLVNSGSLKEGTLK